VLPFSINALRCSGAAVFDHHLQRSARPSMSAIEGLRLRAPRGAGEIDAMPPFSSLEALMSRI
jgi:hypothetical protein